MFPIDIRERWRRWVFPYYVKNRPRIGGVTENRFSCTRRKSGPSQWSSKKQLPLKWCWVGPAYSAQWCPKPPLQPRTGGCGCGKLPPGYEDVEEK
jgi:hypothetical protein